MHTRETTLWNRAWLPVVAVCLGAAAQPLFRLPGLALAPFIGSAAFVVVPATLFVALLAATCLPRLEEGERRVAFAAGGALLGGLVWAAFGTGTTETLPGAAALLAGGLGGAGAAWAAPLEAGRRVLLGLAAAFTFAATLFFAREVTPVGPT